MSFSVLLSRPLAETSLLSLFNDNALIPVGLLGNGGTTVADAAFVWGGRKKKLQFFFELNCEQDKEVWTFLKVLRFQSLQVYVEVHSFLSSLHCVRI